MKFSLTHFTPQISTLEGVDAEFHNLLHSRCLTMAVGTATLAAIIGIELIALKGEHRRVWFKWIREHCRFSRQTCDRYIVAARAVWPRVKTKSPILGDFKPSQMGEADLQRLEKAIFEAIGGISLNALLHSTEEPENLPEVMLRNGMTATLPGGTKAKVAAKSPVTIGDIANFRAAFLAADRKVQIKVLNTIPPTRLATHLKDQGYTVIPPKTK